MAALAHLSRPGKREQNKAQNRAEILTAARQVFTELGYGAASIRDIIRRTNLAAGTFYNYFPDKESIFRELVEESARQVRARLRAARDRATTLEEFVGGAYHAFFQFVADDRVTFELMRRNDAAMRAMTGAPTLLAGVTELHEDLEAAVERGDLPPHDAEYLAAAMAGVGFEVAVRMVERNPPDVDGASRFATELFLGGIERLRRADADPGRGSGRTRQNTKK
jgi:AcrR family transcriptional regulator